MKLIIKAEEDSGHGIEGATIIPTAHGDRQRTGRDHKAVKSQNERYSSFIACPSGQNERPMHPAVRNSQYVAGKPLPKGLRLTGIEEMYLLPSRLLGLKPPHDSV